MNERKNQNSILVIATLGVYLGLMLAGATPHVLAQAAMTRQFDVQDEIEFKDDLDNKPDASAIEEIDANVELTRSLVSDSINSFLVTFDTIAADPFLVSITDQAVPEFTPSSSFLSKRQNSFIRPITEVLSINDLARGSLDPVAAA